MDSDDSSRETSNQFLSTSDDTLEDGALEDGASEDSASEDSPSEDSTSEDSTNTSEETTERESDSEVAISDFEDPRLPSSRYNSTDNDSETGISGFNDPILGSVRFYSTDNDSEVEIIDYDPRPSSTRSNPTRNDSEVATSDFDPRNRVTVIRSNPRRSNSGVEPRIRIATIRANPAESNMELEINDYEGSRIDSTRSILTTRHNPRRNDSAVATSDLETRTRMTFIRHNPTGSDSEVEISDFQVPQLTPRRPDPSAYFPEIFPSDSDDYLTTNDDHDSHEASSNNSRTDGIHANHNSDDSDIVFVQSIPNSSVPQVFTVNSDSEGSDIEPITVAAPVRDSRPEEIEIMEVTGPNSNSVRQPLAATSSTIINETNSSPDIHIKNASSENTDDSCCIICTELYTNSDPHHVVTLKCGHLFGRKCIETWLQPNRHNQRCPQCNKPAKKRDILKIFSRNLRPLDTCERDQFVKKLKLSEDKAKKLEIENKTMKYENRKLHKENEDLKSRMMNCQCHSNFESKRNLTKFPKISPTPKTANFQLAHIKEIDLKAIGARHHCYFKLNDSLVANISRNHNNSPLNFSNFGVIKQSLVADAKADYIFMHKKPIKGMVANQQDGSLITVAADKSLKITSIIAKTTLSSTMLDYEPCSVEIIPQSNIIFVGFKNGTIDMFDRRSLHHPIKVISSHAAIPSPVVSMCMIHCKDPDTRALLAISLDSCHLHTLEADSYDSSFVNLPFTGKSISCDHDMKSGYSLISFRPSIKHQKMTHYVFDWSYDTKLKAIQPCLNRQLEGGSEQIQMARSKIHSNPLNPGSVLVCGPDDRACGAMIWDCKSNFSQPISTYRPLYDFQFIDYSSVDSPILSCLGESFMKLYRIY